MKTIGLIGGMSWESTLPYYRLINEAIRDRLGGLHSAKLVLYSFEFDELERLQRAEMWKEAGQMMVTAAQALERAGADFIVICSNTMHISVAEITSAVKIPLLHIADATARRILDAGVRTVGLLGTNFTMTRDFYIRKLEKSGLRVLVPEARDRDDVHRIIYDELCVGRIESSSREIYRRVMQRLAAAGAEAIIFGCTEIGLLVGAADSAVPIFDTTVIHAQAAAEEALK